MNVNFTPQKKQSPNFKSVSIVQVSKKTFANPENFKACSKSIRSIFLRKNINNVLTMLSKDKWKCYLVTSEKV